MYLETVVENCINIGNIIGPEGYMNSGIVGGTLTPEGNYRMNSYSSKNYIEEDVLCMVEQLNSKDYYLSTIKWQ